MINEIKKENNNNINDNKEIHKKKLNANDILYLNKKTNEEIADIYYNKQLLLKKIPK